MARQQFKDVTWPPFAQQLIDRGEIKGMQKAKREMIFKLALRAGIALAEEERARIEDCENLTMLDRWIDNALPPGQPPRGSPEQRPGLRVEGAGASEASTCSGGTGLGAGHATIPRSKRRDIWTSMLTDTQASSGPVRFGRLHVEGYRSFGAPLSLDRLGRVVVLYGLNNAGKTNLLRAIELIARLLDQPLIRLLDDTPENQEMFFRRTGQEPWMFAQGMPEIVRLEAEIVPGDHCIGFEIARTDDRIRTRLSKWTSAGKDHGKPAVSMRQRYVESMSLQGDEPDSDAQAELSRLEVIWDALRRALRTAWSGSWLPISDEVRASFVQLGRVPDLARRARNQRARSTFAEVTIGLPPGSLQDLSVPLPPDPADPDQPRVRDDVAWVSPGSLLPLDRLGSGAQAIFGLLASLALADAPVILIDEPEQHLNVLQQDAILSALRAALEGMDVGQIFIATHSVKFAKADLDLWDLQREGDATAATRVTPPALRPYEVRGAEGPRSEETSLVAHDGSVELPAYVREALDVAPGQFVYFVPDGEKGFRIVSTAEMKRALGDE